MWVFESEARSLASTWGLPYLPILTFNVGKTKVQDPAKLKRAAKELFNDAVEALTTPAEILKGKYLTRYKEIREEYFRRYGILI
jgi:hypothetical protein